MNEPTHVTINFFIFGGQDEKQPTKGMMDSWLKLTPRERDVCLLAARGMNNNEIAGLKFIAEETVKTHIRNILTKFEMHSKADLRMAMVDSGLLSMVEGWSDGHE